MPPGNFTQRRAPRYFWPKMSTAISDATAGDVEPVNPVEQYLVVQQAHHEHADYARADPIHLPDVGSGELGVFGGAANLQHPQPADEQDEGQQQPVEITV